MWATEQKSKNVIGRVCGGQCIDRKLGRIGRRSSNVDLEKYGRSVLGSDLSPATQNCAVRSNLQVNEAIALFYEAILSAMDTSSRM